MQTTYCFEPITNNLAKLLALPMEVAEVTLTLDFYITTYTAGSEFVEPCYPEIEELNIVTATITFYNQDFTDISYYNLTDNQLKLVWDSLTEAETQRLETCCFVAKESNPDAEDYFDYYFN